MTTAYCAEVTAIGGRCGRVLSADGQLRLALSVPVSTAGATNPEQLLAAACAASFLDALALAAGRSGTALAPDSNVTASVEEGGPEYGLKVRLSIDLPGIERQLILQLAIDAEQLCPLATALRQRTDIQLSVT